MDQRRGTIKGKGIVAVGFLGAWWTGAVLATPISYLDYVAYVAINIGATAYPCASLSDPTCAFVTITATGNTSHVVPFNVTGASGLINNSLQTATLNVFFSNGSTPYTADLVASQLFVSVDQSNGGAGFGSSYGPTYPLATYGSSTGSGNPFENYNLASNFYLQGFAPFCTVPEMSVCMNGAALSTTNGTQIVISYPVTFPRFSIYSSTLLANPVPEPAGLALLGLGLAGVGLARRRQRSDAAGDGLFRHAADVLLKTVKRLHEFSMTHRSCATGASDARSSSTRPFVDSAREKNRPDSPPT